MANTFRLSRTSLVSRIALLTIVVAGVCGCSKIADRREINKLIDSLANRNQEPKRTVVSISWADYAPLFADDYDWNEDRRVRDVIKKLGECDREALWSCLTEHLDDDRFALAYSWGEETAVIRSVGGLCLQQAAHDLEFPYRQFQAFADMRYVMSLRTLDELKAWCRAHTDMPLYEQQIQLCEAAMTKIESCKRFTDEQKTLVNAKIKNEIETLRQTKRPVFGERLDMARGRSFNAAAAKEIKKEYFERKRLGGNPDWPPSR